MKANKGARTSRQLRHDSLKHMSHYRKARAVDVIDPIMECTSSKVLMLIRYGQTVAQQTYHHKQHILVREMLCVTGSHISICRWVVADIGSVMKKT